LLFITDKGLANCWFFEVQLILNKSSKTVQKVLLRIDILLLRFFITNMTVRRKLALF
jgi:hypothetical protein